MRGVRGVGGVGPARVREPSFALRPRRRCAARPDQVEIRKALLDGLVFLMGQGWVLPPLAFMHARASTADLALHVHFLDKVWRWSGVAFVVGPR